MIAHFNIPFGLFKGDDYYRFSRTTSDVQPLAANSGYPRPKSEFNLPDDDFSDAMRWNENGRVYFFAGGIYHRYSNAYLEVKVSIIYLN